MNNLRNILIIKWGALGDLVAATTAIRAVRESFPDATITLLSNRLMTQICPPGSLVDDVILHNEEPTPWYWWLFAQLKLLRTIRSRRFDTAINLRWTSERSAILTWLSGATHRVGSGPRHLKFLYNIQASLVEGRHHEFHRHLDIVEAVGAHAKQVLPYVHCSKEDMEFAESFFQKNNLSKERTIGLHPGASKPSKAWPLERYASLARDLVAQYDVKILVTWGEGEENIARCVAVGARSVGFLAPQTATVGQLSALIQRCGLYICNYSGPMNVAMAAETPLIALGSTSPDDWGPYGDLHRTINRADDKDSYSEDKQLEVMKRISVEEVVRAAAQRMRELYRQESTAVHR